MPPTERRTLRSGCSIRYLTNAPAQPVGLPLLFVPGVSDLADEYEDLLAFFTPRPTFVVEVRGRGGSEAPATGYAVADHVRDLEAVLDEEGIDRFHLMTFSRGTSWSLDLAAAHPGRVASLSIGDYQAGEVGLGEGFAESFAQSRFRGRVVAERMPVRVLEALAAASVSRDLYDVVAGLPAPVLLARAGSGTGIVDDAVEARYRAARPDLEVVTVPDAPHDLFRPDRRAYPAAVASFIERRCPGT